MIPISSATYRLKSGRAIYLTWQTGYYRSRAVGMQFNLVDQEFNEGNAFRWAIWPFNQRPPICPGTNGKQDKLKIKQRDRTVLGGTAKIQDRTQNKTGQSRKGHSKTGKQHSKTENYLFRQ